jgi:K+-sensing histidine kinase KdpD
MRQKATFTPIFTSPLFNEYQRGENSANKPGFGLGLHYCKLVCEKHGGTITAKNGDQGGATFTITIPQPQSTDQKQLHDHE